MCIWGKTEHRIPKIAHLGAILNRREDRWEQGLVLACVRVLQCWGQFVGQASEYEKQSLAN